MKWRIKKCFEEGKPWSGHIYGYRLINRRFEIIPEEAAVIHKIVQCFFEGHGYVKIAKMLNAEGIPSSGGGLWNHAGVSGILKQYNYTGNLLLQTSFTSDYLTKKWNRNRGEYPMYHAEGTHEAIIPLETFKAIQEETERRKKKYLKNYNPEKGEIYPFTADDSVSLLWSSLSPKENLLYGSLGM
jgi:site-specific DNA recombinase